MTYLQALDIIIKAAETLKNEDDNMTTFQYNLHYNALETATNIVLHGGR